MPQDVAQGWKNASSDIQAFKTYADIKQGAQELSSKVGDSAAAATQKISEQLNKISEQQKRFQKKIPTSLDNMLDLFGQTRGNGPETFKYLRKKFLETAVKIGPEVKKILEEESLKAIGCSQEQTYKGVSPQQIQQIGSINSLPQQEGIYIPLPSIDIAGNLKINPGTKIGKTYYERKEPSVSNIFIPYGGFEFFPMKREIYDRTTSQNQNRSFQQEYGKFYQGASGQDLFDFQYTNTNSFNVTGDYLRMILIDRKSPDGTTQGGALNNVGQFLGDYYATIEPFTPSDITSSLINLLSGAVSTKAGLGYDDVTSQSKFALLIQRLLGLCIDNRREIDISGIAKISELEGIDDSFFEFNEVDLRNIELEVSNIQLGVMEFTECSNVKLPVDYEMLVNELDKFNQTQENLTPEQQVSEMEKIIDSISQNPEWQVKLPTSFNASLEIDRNVIKKIPIAVASSVLNPKVLLPIFTMLSVVQSGATYTLNQAITSANTFVASANTVINSANSLSNSAYTLSQDNVITNSVDFIKKFKNFTAEVVTRIGGLFLNTMFDLLKRDLLNLVNIIIRDVFKNKSESYIATCQTLANFLIILAKALKDYRNCKSLIDDILAILRLINGLPQVRQKIPLSLLALSELLPGYSSIRGFINGVKNLQQLGIPTGPLPDGSPNMMTLAFKAMGDGHAKDMRDYGVSDVVVGIPNIGKISIPNKFRVETGA